MAQVEQLEKAILKCLQWGKSRKVNTLMWDVT